MIDWTKQIETVDGRAARLVETHLENRWHIVYANPDPDSCGSKADVFLVNFEGYRCDDRAIYSKRQEPFIRNVRVKREGWVLKRKFLNLLGDYRVFENEKDAFEASSLSEQLIRIEWEE